MASFSASNSAAPDTSTGEIDTDHDDTKKSNQPAWKMDVAVKLLTKVKNRLYLKDQGLEGETSNSGGYVPHIDLHLVRSMMAIIGSTDLLGAAPCSYLKVLNTLKFVFSNGREVGSLVEKIDEGSNGIASSETTEKEYENYPSDLEDLLKYKPVEAFGEKVTQILANLCIQDLDSAIRELVNFWSMKENADVVLLHAGLDDSICFIGKTFECFINFATGRKLDTISGKKWDRQLIPMVGLLSAKNKAVLKVVQTHIFRNFRYKTGQRVDMLKEVVAEDPSGVEWWITLAEASRRRRRDIPKHAQGKRPDMEEYEYMDNALKLDSQNPYVRLSLLDCIVDCLRDGRGSFKCGGMVFSSNSTQTIVYMKNSCRELVKEFPRSVKFHSQISDYFARFVTLCFFDVPFAEECLEIAYKLNPDYPPTSHRLGIFLRMSKGDLTKSFHWFVKAATLDQFHYNAFMECVKNWIGRPKEYNVPKLIEEKLRTDGACSWSDLEILDLLFYKGIGHFIRNEFNEALDTWTTVSVYNPRVFRLCDFDQTGGFYNWDENIISTDKLRLWMQQEKSKKDRNELVTYLYNLMLGIVEPKKVNIFYNPLCCALFFRSDADDAQALEEESHITKVN